MTHDPSRDDVIRPEEEEMDPADVAARFRVLVVDDNLINQKVPTRVLKRIGVVEIETTGNGYQALNAVLNLAKFIPNSLLIDLQMPLMDGFELIANLIDRTPKLSPLVIAYFADWAPETDEKCLERGFDSLLRKPITFFDIKTFGPPWKSL